MSSDEKAVVESEEGRVDDEESVDALLETRHDVDELEVTEETPRARRFRTRPDAYGWVGLGVFAASGLATIIVALMFPNDGMVYFRMGALMGAVLGLAGAIIRVIAHQIEDKEKKLDLFGKVFAIFAGVYALMFAIALLMLQIVLPQPLGG